MQLLREPEAFRRACDEARARGERVGLVPTMGALHAGHVALVNEALRHASFALGETPKPPARPFALGETPKPPARPFALGETPKPPARPFVAVTVFVNPTQFGPNEDLARYPRTLEADLERCERAGASVVFAPAPEAMYPPGDETRVRVGVTAEPLCGAYRPGHFEGVATVVAKLFALAGPCVAVFGRKDYQQLRVISRMAADLFLPVEIVGLRTVREPDGLALSSRNAYLSADERAAALAIPRGLSAAVAAFARGERDAGALAALARESVTPVATSIDYVDVADPETLRVLSAGDRVGERALLALAIRIGKTRLIDNVVLGEDPSPIAPVSASGGVLLVLEGIDGAGKTTQAELVARQLVQDGFEVVRTKEPTDGPWGQKVRASASTGRLAPEEELAAFVADRREHVEKLIRPALASGKVVIVDRYYFSTAAYQGARGMDPESILRQNEAFAPPPDLLVHLDVEPAVGVKRIAARGDVGNLFEREEDLRKSAAIFRALVRPFLLRLPGDEPREAISAAILTRLYELPFFVSRRSRTAAPERT